MRSETQSLDRLQATPRLWVKEAPKIGSSLRSEALSVQFKRTRIGQPVPAVLALGGDRAERGRSHENLGESDRNKKGEKEGAQACADLSRVLAI